MAIEKESTFKTENYSETSLLKALSIATNSISIQNFSTVLRPDPCICDGWSCYNLKATYFFCI